MSLEKSDLFLFVSHVAENRDSAMEIVDELERRGTRCWIAPRNIRPGEPFDDEIADAIESSRAMLLIFSDLCNDSEYIRREVTVAGESHKTVIPFRIEDVQPRRGLRVRLSDLHWIDGFTSRERAIDEVIKKFAPPANTTGRGDSTAPTLRVEAERKIAAVRTEAAPVGTRDDPRSTERATAAREPVHREPTSLPDASRHGAESVSQPLGKPAVAAHANRWPIVASGVVVAGVLALGLFYAVHNLAITPAVSPTPTVPTAAATAPTATPTTPTTLSTSLAGHWPFDGNTTNWDTGTVADLSGNGNTGTMVGMSTATSRIAGKIGQAVEFNGKNYITVPDSASLRISGALSVFTWLKVFAFQNFPTIISKHFSANNYQLGLNNGTGQVRPCLALTCVTSSGQVPLNSWSHVGFTYDGSSLEIYINGALDSTFATAVTLPTSSDPLTIAKDGTSLYPFSGAIGDLRIYSRTLSAHEVAQLYAAVK